MIIFITNTETIPGIVFSIDEIPNILKIKHYPENFTKNFQFLTSSVSSAFLQWNIHFVNFIHDEWYKARDLMLMSHLQVTNLREILV